LFNANQQRQPQLFDYDGKYNPQHPPTLLKTELLIVDMMTHQQQGRKQHQQLVDATAAPTTTRSTDIQLDQSPPSEQMLTHPPDVKKRVTFRGSTDGSTSEGDENNESEDVDCTKCTDDDDDDDNPRTSTALTPAAASETTSQPPFVDIFVVESLKDTLTWSESRRLWYNEEDYDDFRFYCSSDDDDPDDDDDEDDDMENEPDTHSVNGDGVGSHDDDCSRREDMHATNQSFRRMLTRSPLRNKAFGLRRPFRHYQRQSSQQWDDVDELDVTVVSTDSSDSSNSDTTRPEARARDKYDYKTEVSKRSRRSKIGSSTKKKSKAKDLWKCASKVILSGLNNCHRFPGQ
jgi:hypothetical protein